MFCPNCGNNCGDAKFCSSCGTSLLGDVSTESTNEFEWEDCYAFPYRGFYQNGTTVTLEYSFLTVEKKRLFSKERSKIPFTKLAQAEFVYYGGTTARMLFTTMDGKRVAAEINGERECSLYFVIFYLIKYLAVPETEFVTELPPVDMDRLKHLGVNVDLRSYFDRFNPSREHAAAALSCECQIPLQEAEPVIDSAFYKYQKELYDANPILAVRDYNRIMAERLERCEEYAREVDNRGLKYRRYHSYNSGK